MVNEEELDYTDSNKHSINKIVSQIEMCATLSHKKCKKEKSSRVSLELSFL